MAPRKKKPTGPVVGSREWKDEWEAKNADLWRQGNPILKDSQLSPAELKRVNAIRARIADDTMPAPMFTAPPFKDNQDERLSDQAENG